VRRDASEHFLHLAVFHSLVILGDALLIRAEVVEGAVVGLGVAALGAEDVAALAGDLDEADFLTALPTLVCVILNK